MPDSSPVQIRDRRQAPWCWQDRRALQRIADALRAEGGAASALAVYVALTLHAGADERCWPTVRALAELAGVSAATVRRRIQDLELLGLVEVVEVIGDARGDTSNTYDLLAVPDSPPAPDWHDQLPPARSLANLDQLQRTRAKSTDSSHRGNHRDSPPTLTMTPPPPRHASPGASPRESGTLTMRGPLTERTSINERDSENDGTFRVSDSWHEQMPAPLESFAGMPARSIWAAILDEAAPHLSPAVAAGLRPCYLGGTPFSPLVVAAGRAAADLLERKALPALSTAAAQILGPGVTLVVWRPELETPDPEKGATA